MRRASDPSTHKPGPRRVLRRPLAFEIRQVQISSTKDPNARREVRKAETRDSGGPGGARSDGCVRRYQIPVADVEMPA